MFSFRTLLILIFNSYGQNLVVCSLQILSGDFSRAMLCSALKIMVFMFPICMCIFILGMHTAQVGF